ncbi:AAA family ATPase [uncultured Tateyamaria sp.]|uniref:AAA family ATPase n=1 Tax=uncultured Tateyamaria sp. TaxID=455651 RepID=UPI002615E6E1|nr:AAA family ATPase [uncultured Tateyamaria sp.]
MNGKSDQGTSKASVFSSPKSVPDFKGDANLSERWTVATKTVAILAAQQGWNKSEVARRADMAIGTFSGWYDGTYGGRYDTTTKAVEKLIAQVRTETEARSALPVEPAFLQTRVARELFEAFTYAQMMPTMAIATLVSGLGKTEAAEAFQAMHPHVYIVTLSPSSRSPHTMKTEIGTALGLDTKNGATLKLGITTALKRDGFSALLIVDEAQNLSEESINELRYFRDKAKCGLVLLGNDETTTPYASRDINHASTQVVSRIGFRVNVMRPFPEDVEAFLDAWQIDREDLRETARKVSNKPGAFRALGETMKLAAMIARGQGRPMEPIDIKIAYERRGGGIV